MLGENIRILRKRKGYSQETLAQQLHVVRQTVSKWEKGLSVPDAQMLSRLAELLEVSVSDLLGSKVADAEEEREPDLQAIAQQLAILNEQLAASSARKRKRIKGLLLGIMIFFLSIVFILSVLTVLGMAMYDASSEASTARIECIMDGETYEYEIRFDDKHRVTAEGGDEWFLSNPLSIERPNDAMDMIVHIQEYVLSHGGTYQTTIETP